MSENISTNINWFPGHMAKTRRQIKESLKLVDAVIELRDARIPVSSTNPELNELIEGKPKIILLNKADLADEAATAKWLATLRENLPTSSVMVGTGILSGSVDRRRCATMENLTVCSLTYTMTNAPLTRQPVLA